MPLVSINRFVECIRHILCLILTETNSCTIMSTTNDEDKRIKITRTIVFISLSTFGIKHDRFLKPVRFVTLLRLPRQRQVKRPCQIFIMLPHQIMSTTNDEDKRIKINCSYSLRNKIRCTPTRCIPVY